MFTADYNANCRLQVTADMTGQVTSYKVYIWKVKCNQCISNEKLSNRCLVMLILEMTTLNTHGCGLVSRKDTYNTQC